MTPNDPVPEADRLEQEEPPGADPYARTPEHLAAGEPEADVLEQELPLDVDEEPEGPVPDEERVEPADGSEADRLEERAEP